MNPFSLQSAVPANQGWKAQRTLVYGTHGLGKSTFGATYKKPLLIRTEDGADNLGVYTFPKLVETFPEMLAALETVHNEQHDFKTIIIDSLDWLEPIVWAATCAKHGQPSIESFGYGKGYIETDAEWKLLMSWFDALRNNRGMETVLIAHSEIKNYASPETEPYDRYQIKLHKRAFGLWQEWADMVLFCKFKTSIERTETGFNQEARRGAGTGERVICTEERPAFLAKNRWGLPPEIYIGTDKTWGAFHKALNQCTEGRYELPENLQGENTK